MPQPAFFYPDPQPQRRLPTVPIGTQGQQPPRRWRELTIANVVRWSWELPDPLPTIPQRRYAYPLTLPAVSQPPRATGLVNDMLAAIFSWQPPDPQPTLPFRRFAVVDTFPRVSQPPLGNQPAAIVENAILRMWQPPDPQPQRDPKTIAPLTLTYGNQPTRKPTAGLVQLISAWWQPATQPPPVPVEIAPLISVVVAAAQVPYTSQALSLAIRSWSQNEVTAVHISDTAALIEVLDVVPPYSPAVMLSIISTWQPPDPMPQRDRRYIAPLTLTYGQQPPLGQPGNIVEGIVSQSWPAAWWPAQSAEPVAPLIPAVIVTDPPRWTPAVMLSLVRSWTPPDPQPQRDRGYIAPLTLTYGQQPPRYSRVTQRKIVSAWQPPDPMPAQLELVAPLIPIPIVSQPPRLSWVNQSLLVRSWLPAEWPAKLRSPFFTFVGGAITPIRPITVHGKLLSPLAVHGMLFEAETVSGMLFMPVTVHGTLINSITVFGRMESTITIKGRL